MNVESFDCYGYLVEWRFCSELAAYVALMIHDGAIYQVVSQPTRRTMKAKCAEYATGTGRLHKRCEGEN